MPIAAVSPKKSGAKPVALVSTSRSNERGVEATARQVAQDRISPALQDEQADWPDVQPDDAERNRQAPRRVRRAPAEGVLVDVPSGVNREFCR